MSLKATAHKKILILGGTSEARALAAALSAHHHVTTSLAGRTRNPALLPGTVRTGGFGGAEGLAAYLRAEKFDHVVDATHPFAATITQNAFEACRQAKTPRLRLNRAPWTPAIGARWIHAASLEDAATKLPDVATRAFLTVGAHSLSAFANIETVWFLVRLLNATDRTGLNNAHVIAGRPPFSFSDELALLKTHTIDCVVSKNAGGDASRAKIDAAAKAGIAVMMIERPSPPEGDTVQTVEDALRLLSEA